MTATGGWLPAGRRGWGAILQPMDRTGLVEEIAERMRPLLEADERIRFAYLFGSAARAAGAEPGDVDVAMSVTDWSLPAEASLADALASRLGRHVDVVVLERAPPWLQFRILGEGAVVFSRDEPARIAFRERVERAFLDFRPYHEEYLAALRQRAREGLLSRG